MKISESNNLFEGASGLTPAIALKFFLDKRRSQNLVAQESFLPSETWNFFEP
jgi:membrane carboxypeptidase/penicillin-binding protein